MCYKKNNGVTLTALTITIVVMLIISSTVIYNAQSHINVEKINKLYQDIDSINTKIDDYYLKYGDIPTLALYCDDQDTLISIIENNATAESATLSTSSVVVNPNDGDEYYIIDLEKLDGLVLNYGYGDNYKSIKDDPTSASTSITDIYVINAVTHQIYYPDGVFVSDIMYYCYNMDYTDIS